MLVEFMSVICVCCLDSSLLCFVRAWVMKFGVSEVKETVMVMERGLCQDQTGKAKECHD